MKHGSVIFNTKTTGCAGAPEPFPADRLQKLEGREVRVAQAGLQTLFALPPCTPQAGGGSRRVPAAEEGEHHLQFQAWESRPEGAGRKESQRGARSGGPGRGRSGAGCGVRGTPAVSGARRRGRRERGAEAAREGRQLRQVSLRTASQLAAAPVPEADSARGSLPSP